MDGSFVKISIIFPSYNGEKVISTNLESIQNLNIVKDLEVIIIDNNSSDSTRAIIKSYKTFKIVLIEKKENLGFAKACNIGVKLAKGEFIFITNQDVKFPKYFFDILLDLYHNIKKNKEIIICPALDFPGRYINYFGAKIHFLGFSYTPEMYQKIFKDVKTFLTLKAAGSSMFMKKKTFFDLDGFDPYFFMYHEDTDFSLKAKRNGIRIYTTNKTILRHQKIHMLLNNFSYYYIERNRYLVIYKNHDKFVNLIPFFIITEIMLLFHAILIKKIKIRFKIYKYLLLNYRNIRLLRYNERNIRIRKLKKRELDCHLDAIILGKILSKVKILKLFLKILNLIL